MKNRNEMHLMLKKQKCKIGAELGVAKGHFSKYLTDNHDFDIFFCIDKWNDHHDENEKNYVIDIFKNKRNVKIFQMDFEKAIDLFQDEYFDFIYIDGYAHTGQNEGHTLRQWYPKLKSGGIFSGHDYCEQKWPKTFNQVNKFLKEELAYEINVTQEIINPSWYIIKR